MRFISGFSLTLILWFLGASTCLAYQESGPIPTGLNPEKRLTQYLTRNWTVEHGLPRNNILAGAQTTDGYLWFGGFGGLARFDGTSFQVYNSRSDSAFFSDGIYALHADTENRLWIGTQGGGLLLYEGGQFHQMAQDSALQRASVFALTPDRRGGLWLATSEGLLHYAEGTFSTPTSLEAVAKMRIRELLVDDGGQLWIGTSNEGLYRYNGQNLHFIGTQEGLPSGAIHSLAQAPTGHIWVGTWNGLAKVNAQGEVVGVQQNQTHQPNRSLDAALVDGHGSLWVGGLEGLGRYAHGRWRSFEPRVGFQLKEISTLFTDHQGSLWVGTYRHGIWQITDGKFANFSIPEGLTGGVAYAMLAEEDRVFVGTESGLTLLQEESVANYTLGNDNQNFVRDILRDRTGRLWLCTYGGLVEWNQQVVRRISTEQGLATNQTRTLAEDHDGNLWLATRVGLYRIEDGQARIPEGFESLATQFILSLYVDASGMLWIGTNGNGLYRWDGQQLDHFTREDGLGNDFIFRMTEDGQGGLWIGTTGGLSRYYQGQFLTLTASQGLPSNVVFQPLADARGRLWLVSDANVWSATLKDLYAVITNKRPTLNTVQTFDKYDGLLAGQPTSVSASTISPDEKLYVCTPLGFSVLNLAADHMHPAPPMHIDVVRTDEGEFAPGDGITLSAGNRQMAVFYTAFDYYAPQALQFRYMLEGFDTDWVSVDNRRVAVYTNLSPGEYTFRLMVANHDEEWSEEVLSLPVVQEAYFYQTQGFKFLLLFFFVALGVVLHFARIHLLEAHNKRLSQLVTKRTHMIEKQKTAIEEQATMLQSTFLKINDSILYARRIQDALQPSAQALAKTFPESFIVYLPKDVVSGDFYWFEQVGDKVIIAAVDCTGHGIPGAFMSVLGNTLLTQIVNLQGLTDPQAILQELHTQTVQHLQQASHEEQMQDGMDLGLVTLDFAANTLSFAGAKRPLVYMNAQGQQQIIKGDRRSIGAKDSRRAGEFHTHTLPLAQVREFFLFTDGYADQFGGTENRKFMTRHFYQLLAEVSGQPAAQQRTAILERYQSWRDTEEQVDDILVLGVQLPQK